MDLGVRGCCRGRRRALARLPLPTTAQLTELSTLPTPPQVVVAAVQVVAAVLAGCNPCRGRGSGTTDAQSTPQEWKKLQRGFLAHPEMVVTCLKRVLAQHDTIPAGRWERARRMDNGSVTVASVRQGSEAAGLMLAANINSACVNICHDQDDVGCRGWVGRALCARLSPPPCSR